MGQLWQTLVVLLVVAVAAGVLIRRVWRTAAGRGGGCGSCGECPQEPEESSSLVQLGDRAAARRSD